MVLSASKKNGPFCDVAASYGVGDLNQLIEKRYDLFFSLWLNKDRTIIRHAESVRLGAITAMTGSQKVGWYAALTDTVDEAKHHFHQHQAAMVRTKKA